MAWRSLILLVQLATVGVFLIPAVSAQGTCQTNPALPSCVTPTVEVSMPSSVRASGELLFRGQEVRVNLTVNVTYRSPVSPPGEQSTVTVVPKAVAGLSVKGGTGAVSPQATVSITVEIFVPPQTLAGRYPLQFFVNTTGTNVHRPTSQEAETDLVVPWWVRAESWTTATAPPVEGDRAATFSVQSLRANGPVDLLVTVVNATHTVEPRILRTSLALGRGDAVTEEWTLRFKASSSDWVYVEAIWAVVSSANGLSCLLDTGDLLPVEDERPGDACLRMGGGLGMGGGTSLTGQLGGLPGIVWSSTSALVLMGMVGAVALGAFVLRRGGGQPPARALGAYLLLHGFVFGAFALRMLVQELFGRRVADRFLPDWVGALVAVTFVALPAAMLTFALSYPTLHRRLRGSKLWLVVPVAPSLLLMIFAVFTFLRSPQEEPLLLMSIVIGYACLALALSSLLFWRRARHASTQLERSRLLFMLRFVAFPLAASAAFVLVIFLTDMLGLTNTWEIGVAGLAIAALALLPIAGMAWGVLRYKVVDLERGLRFTVSQGFVGAVFLTVFFAVSESAQVLLADRTQSALLGIGGASILLFAIAPLERLGKRVASRAVPERLDSEAYQAFRRLEVYRATFEEVAADQAVTERERRALASLARTLRLSADEVAFIESESLKELGTASARRRPNRESQVG